MKNNRLKQKESVSKINGNAKNKQTKGSKQRDQEEKGGRERNLQKKRKGGIFFLKNKKLITKGVKRHAKIAESKKQ